MLTPRVRRAAPPRHRGATARAAPREPTTARCAWVAPDDRSRFGPCYAADPSTGELDVHDPVDGQWSAPPPFASGADGLVSTIDDVGALAAVLRAGGSVDGRQVLSPGPPRRC